MSKNDRKKVGLHKEISSIFKGVVIPGREGGTESSISSKSEDTDNAVPTGPAVESQKDEVLKPYQAVQTLPEAESAQESKVEPVEQTKVEPVEESKFEPAEELETEAVEESKFEPIEEPKAEPVEELNAEPVEESKFELAEELETEAVEELKAEPIEEPKTESVEESKLEPVKEAEAEPVHAPKFLTAQESKVVPIQESDDEPTQETEDKPASAPKFVTAGESKVIPIHESEVEPTQDSGTEQDKQPEKEPVLKSKFKKDKKPKVIPVKESKKTDIEKISKKVSKKPAVVKVGGEDLWSQIKSKLCGGDSGAGGAKQKAMVVIVPVLFIVLIIFVLKGGVFGTSAHNVQAGQEDNNSEVISTNVSNEIDWEVPEPYPTTLRDPMKLGPVVKSDNQIGSVNLEELRVRSILCSEDKSSAIVGNSIVHEGDDIGGGVKIIKISKDGVEFEMNGKKWIQKVQR